MYTKQIVVEDNKTIDYLHALSIEVEARKELISFIITSNLNCDTTQFTNYNKEYMDYFAEYSVGKKKFENSLKAMLNSNEKLVSWALDFDSAIVELTIDNNDSAQK